MTASHLDAADGRSSRRSTVVGTIGWPAGPHLRLGARSARNLPRALFVQPSLMRGFFFGSGAGAFEGPTTERVGTTLRPSHPIVGIVFCIRAFETSATQACIPREVEYTATIAGENQRCRPKRSTSGRA